MDEPLFTTGEFAAKAGITERTLRYYDKIGLLKPSSYSKSGHRLYSRNDFAKLQKILTLKFIGLSLQDIDSIMAYDTGDSDFRKSLEIQRDIIEKKIHNMQSVMAAIDEALNMTRGSNVLNWDKFVNIINVLNLDKNWLEQYKNASNLRARIRIHELYSTNKEGWMQWYFKQLKLKDNSRILELGCGDASLWAKNINSIPEGWDITLTDFSQGMLKDAKKMLGNNAERFKFKIVDAESIPFENENFDVVIANHMLYHVPDIDRAFSEIYRVLKYGGYFYASTVGKNHMAQMREIAEKFGSGDITVKSWDYTEKFQLENGEKQLSRWFGCIELKRYEDNLIVTDPEPLIDYIFSMPGNERESFDRTELNELIESLKYEITKSGGIYITKDTGFFRATKIDTGKDDN